MFFRHPYSVVGLTTDFDLCLPPLHFSIPKQTWLSQYLQHLAQATGRASFESHLSPHLTAEENSMLSSLL